VLAAQGLVPGCRGATTAQQRRRAGVAAKFCPAPRGPSSIARAAPPVEPAPSVAPPPPCPPHHHPRRGHGPALRADADLVTNSLRVAEVAAQRPAGTYSLMLTVGERTPFGRTGRTVAVAAFAASCTVSGLLLACTH